MALSTNRSSAHIKQMAAEFFKKVTHIAIDFAKYLSMTFPFFVRDGIFAICDMLLLKWVIPFSIECRCEICSMYIVLMTQIRNLTRFIHNMSIVKLLIIYIYYKRIHSIAILTMETFFQISMCCSYLWTFSFLKYLIRCV